MSYSKIINPKTGRLVKTSSKLGKNILLKYIDSVNKLGGAGTVGGPISWPGNAPVYMGEDGVGLWRPPIVNPSHATHDPALFVGMDGEISSDDSYRPRQPLTDEEAWKLSSRPTALDEDFRGLRDSQPGRLGIRPTRRVGREALSLPPDHPDHPLNQPTTFVDPYGVASYQDPRKISGWTSGASLPPDHPDHPLNQPTIFADPYGVA